MTKQSYSEKLRDPRWQKKRLEILNRDEFTCQLCKDTTSTLNIHHLEYKGDPWHVENSKLITLCEHCHAIIELQKEDITSDIIGCIKQVFDDYIYLTVVLRQDEKNYAVVYEINQHEKEIRYAMNEKYLSILVELMEQQTGITGR